MSSYSQDVTPPADHPSAGSGQDFVARETVEKVFHPLFGGVPRLPLQALSRGRQFEAVTQAALHYELGGVGCIANFTTASLRRSTFLVSPQEK